MIAGRRNDDSLNPANPRLPKASDRLVKQTSVLWVFLVLLACHLCWSREKKKEEFGAIFSVEIAAPQSEVEEAVRAVVDDGMIEGSKEYNKDKFIGKATSAPSCSLFPQWTDPGSVFYKVRTGVLAPENFKETADQGTVAVRYVVQSKTPTQTILRIDAIFVEDFRRRAHASNGSIESAEFKQVQDHVDALEEQKKQAEEGQKHREQEMARLALEKKSEADDEAALVSAQGSVQTLEQHVQALRRQAERLIKAPGAQLKSAPFHSASSLKSLDAGSEVVILVSTTYWYGIETEDGEHGWVRRDQVELLP